MIDVSALYLPGAVALWCALFFALCVLWGYAESLLRGPRAMVSGAGSGAADDEADEAEPTAAAGTVDPGRRFARRAFVCFAVAIVLASAVLLVLFLRRDFRIEYVYQYSGLDLPWWFQLSAFWAGQKGSFLIWLLWGALLGLPLMKASGEEEAPVMGVYTLTLMGLLFILVRENPFVMLPQTPMDGEGLNPLLQNNWMVIHPPIMFVGYAASAIPFSFAVAALWRRRYDRWAHLAFPWALGGFLVLGTAILMGGYWAYITLGWGGYWGWDPVENASLIPFLLGTVLIHGLYMERHKGRYRRANLTIACLLYLSVLYGTFLTRSGVLADFSVHSFVDLGISGWLVGLMVFFVGLSLWLLASRYRQIPTTRSEDPLLSRGSFLVLATVAIGLSALVVTIGTSAPLLTRFMENPGQVGPEFYNRVNLPIALLVALLLAAIPFLTWRGASPSQLVHKMAPAAGGAGVVTVGAAVLGVRDPFHLLFLLLAATAAITNLQRTIEKFARGGLRSAGGYLAHVGVGIILVGFLASSAYDESAKVTLSQGEPTEVGDLTLTFERFLPRQGRQRERMQIEVVRESGESYHAYPQLYVNDRTRQLMAHPHVHTLLLEDLYISPIEFDPGQAGDRQRLQLAKGESATVGNAEIRFVGFDLRADGDALAQMASGGTVTVGAEVEVTREDRSETLVPLYSFTSSGQVMAPPVPLPDGGELMLTGIDASTGAVRLDVIGLGDAESTPPKLSVDVTRKPLIQLVWFGLYVILAGGSIAVAQRAREARLLERLGLATSSRRR